MGPAGFEPATFRLRAERSTRLSYKPSKPTEYPLFYKGHGMWLFQQDLRTDSIPLPHGKTDKKVYNSTTTTTLYARTGCYRVCNNLRMGVSYHARRGNSVLYIRPTRICRDRYRCEHLPNNRRDKLRSKSYERRCERRNGSVLTEKQ